MAVSIAGCRLRPGNGPLMMSQSEETYQNICRQIWDLYQAQVQKETPRPSKRKVFFPPPPRDRPVDLLFVGISPSQASSVAFQSDKSGAEQFARDFQYLKAAGSRPAGYSNDSYYGPLTEFARRVDPRLGVWPEVLRGEKQLLIEFTDALHISTDHRIADDLLAVMNPQRDDCPVCAQCRSILAAELNLYRPRVVICNGRLPSKFVFEVCMQHPFKRPVEQTMLSETSFGGKVHFSGYLVSKWIDGFSRARLLREIKENTVFGSPPSTPGRSSAKSS